jgi:hypothetical protein
MCWSFIAATEQEIAGEIPSDTILVFYDACSSESADFCIALFSAMNPTIWLPSMPLVLNQRPTDFCRGFKVVEYRLINFAQIPPRIFIAIEAVEKQHVRQ